MRNSCKKLHIGILMLNSPNIQDYAHIASMINYIYSSKHGYNFITHRCPRKEDINKDWKWDQNEKNEYLLVWSKPNIIRQYLPFFDYLFFIDSDAIFYDQTKTIEEFIEKQFEDPNTSIVWAEDCLNKDYCWAAGSGNTGSIAVKNCENAYRILDKWIKAPLEDICSKWKQDHPREQACFNKLVKLSDVSPYVKMVKYNIMNGEDGVWIRHYMGATKEHRTTTLKHFLNKLLSDQGYLNITETFIDQNMELDRTKAFFFVLISFMIIVLGIIIIKRA